jgi:hypothetical protein
MQKDFHSYGENFFVFQKLLFGTSLSKNTRENFETLILLTLPPNLRYNVYSNWRKRESSFNPFFGKKHTLKARKEQSLSKIGKPSNFVNHIQANSVKKMISSLNKGTTNKDRRKPLYIDSIYYESISEASEKTGLNRRLIRERCHQQTERFENYKWA